MAAFGTGHWETLLFLATGGLEASIKFLVIRMLFISRASNLYASNHASTSLGASPKLAG